MKSKDARFHWSLPLVSRSNCSDRRIESPNGSGPQHERVVGLKVGRAIANTTLSLD